MSEGVAAIEAVPDWSRFWVLAKADTPDVEGVYYQLIAEGARTEPLFSGSFNIVNERAVDYAAQESGRLVVGLSQSSQAALRTTMGSTLGGNYTVASASRTIRDIVGLDPPRATAVVNFRNSLEAAGFAAADVDRRVADFARRQVAARASTIARTETLRAAHMGQLEVWRAAAERGLIDPNTTRRVWVTTDDDRICEECASLDGESIEFEGQFASGEGNVSETPPIHPNCRCTSELEFDEDAANLGGVDDLPEVPSDLVDDVFDPKGFSSDRYDDRLEILGKSDYGKTLAEAIEQWQTGKAGFTRLKDGVYAFLRGDTLPGRTLEKVRTLLGAARSVQSEAKLFRGTLVRESTESVLHRFSPGSTFDIGLSSFTSHRQTAGMFAMDPTNAAKYHQVRTFRRGTPVVFEVEPGARGLPIQNLAPNDFLHAEREWIAGGRFSVVDARETTMMGRKVVVVRVRQVGTVG